MSKRSRTKDNSKRQQPVHQHRAEAARQALSQSKASKNSEPQKQDRQERSADKSGS